MVRCVCQAPPCISSSWFLIGSGMSSVSGSCCMSSSSGAHVGSGVCHTWGAFSMLAALCPICSACSTGTLQPAEGVPKVKKEEEPKWSPSRALGAPLLTQPT